MSRVNFHPVEHVCMTVLPTLAHGSWVKVLLGPLYLIYAQKCLLRLLVC